MARSSDINQRLVLVGGEEVRRQLEQIGKAGQQSFGAIADAAAAPTTAVSGLSREFVTLNKQVSAFLKGVTNKAFVVGLAGATTAALRFAGGVANMQKSLEDLAKQTGASGKDLLALQQAFRASGVDGDLAGTVAASLGDAFHQARITSDALQKSLSGGVTALRGIGAAAADAAKGVTLFKGTVQGAPNLFDQLRGPALFRGGRDQPKIELPKETADILKALRITPPEAGASPEEQVKAWAAVTKALTEVLDKNADIGEELAKNLFKTDKWRDVLKGLQTAFATGNLGKFRAEVERLGLVLGPEQQKQAEQYRIAVANLGTAWESLKTQAAVDLFPTLTAGIQATTQSLRDATVTAQAFGALMSSLGQAVASANLAGLAAGLQAAAQPLIAFGQQIFDAWAQATRDQFNNLIAALGQLDWSQFFMGLFHAGEWVVGQLQAMFTDLWNSLKSLASGIGSVLGAAGAGGGIQMPGFAEGGMVRGPGTGTSDSIAARLSNGEFVVNALATRMNLPILEALNAMRKPIMPRLSMPRGFAMGGLVTAGGGGASAHFHFSNGTTGTLTGPRSVIELLTKEARRAAMVSAGKKPSTA